MLSCSRPTDLVTGLRRSRDLGRRGVGLGWSGQLTSFRTTVLSYGTGMAHACPQARETGWCPLCYEGRRGRAFHAGHVGVTRSQNRKVRKWKMLKRVVAEAGENGGSSRSLESCQFLKGLPTVAEFLSLSRWEDGASRETGTVTLFFEEGLLKACLNDRDSGSSAFISARTFTSLFQAMEKGLLAGSLEWRQRGAGKAKPGKRSG